MELTLEQQQELDELYWQTDISTRELQRYFGLSKAVHTFVTPLLTGVPCPNCGAQLVYKSRAARSRDEKACERCGHSERYYCECEYCKRIREEERQRYEEWHRQQEMQAFKARLEETSSPEYVTWALSKLSRRDKIFLRAFLEVVQESTSPTWEAICDRAKVVSYKKYVNKLVDIGLLYRHPNGTIMVNPAVRLEMIKIKCVRKISKSLRFEVFQRDKYTCQYCGRKPPEVELEVDHLIPVAEGGTDDFDNLVTSCRDCNRGKSTKIIEAFTGGYSKQEWREILRRKRLETLRARRAQLEDVMQYWAECRKMKSVPTYDANAIYNFIERYEPEWIKAAIRIASRKRPSNYVKYVAGILRNWAQNGPPDYVANPDLALDRRKATPKQIEYIRGLLKALGLQLGDFYHKSDFDELTMLDAHNLIEALTESELSEGHST